MARRRGRPRKISIEKLPEFFKIYFPNRCSEQLRIPPDFIKYFSGTIPNEVTLKDCSGKVWHADVEKIDSRLYIKNGWKCFVNDNSLELGEFLVFRYNGNSSFDVGIYSKDGCKKEQNLEDENTGTSLKIKEEIEVESTRPVADQNLNRKCSEIGRRSSLRSRVSQGLYLATAEELEEFDAGELLISKNPYFVASFNRRIHNYLRIPKTFLTKNDIKLKPEMVLRDPNGKSWTVGVLHTTDDRLCFSKGWANFRSDNHLLYHKFIFEFVVGKGGKVNKVIRVHWQRRMPTM